MTKLNEQDKKFRNFMYLVFALLLISYVGLKAWHIQIALDVFSQQSLPGDVRGAAK